MRTHKLQLLLIFYAYTLWGCSDSLTIGQLDPSMTARELTNSDSESDADAETDKDAGADGGGENEETLNCGEDEGEWNIRETDAPMLAIWGSQVPGAGYSLCDIFAVGGTLESTGEMPPGLIYNKTVRKGEWRSVHYNDYSIEYPIYGVWGIDIDPAPDNFPWGLSHDVIVVHRGGADRRVLNSAGELEWREEAELNNLFTEDGAAADGGPGKAGPILTAVHGSDSENIFVVGSREWVGGTPPLTGAPRGSHIAHYNGTSWSLMDVEPSSKEALENAWLTDIWYDSEQQRAFAISSSLPDPKKWNEKGASTGAIFEYSDQVWRQAYPTSQNKEEDTKYFFFSVWGSQDKQEIFVVGSRMEPPEPDILLPTFSLFVLRRKGGAWQQETELPAGLINRNDYLISGAGIWGDGDDVYVVGTQIGYKWTLNRTLEFVLKLTPKASQGFMVHYDYKKAKWYRVRYPESEDGSFPFGLSDIWGFSDRNYHLVGANGIMNCIEPMPVQ